MALSRMATFAEQLQKLYILAGQAALVGALWICVTQALSWYASRRVANSKAAQASPGDKGSSGAPSGTANGAAAEASAPVDEVCLCQERLGLPAAPCQSRLPDNLGLDLLYGCTGNHKFMLDCASDG